MAAKRAPAAPATPTPKPATAKRAAGSKSSSAAPPAAAAKAGKASARGKATKTATAPSPAPAPARAAPSPTVTLKQLAAQLAEAHALSRKQGEAVMAGVVGLVVAHLKAGDRLRIGGLGVLEVTHRPARRGRNPATGAAIQIAASKKIAFRAAKELKEAV